MKIKAYLQENGEVKEIRRFEFDLENRSYSALLNKIEGIFDVSSCKLGYKDDDGDLVVFASQQETKEALLFIKDDNFHVYVLV